MGNCCSLIRLASMVKLTLVKLRKLVYFVQKWYFIISPNVQKSKWEMQLALTVSQRIHGNAFYSGTDYISMNMKLVKLCYLSFIHTINKVQLQLECQLNNFLGHLGAFHGIVHPIPLMWLHAEIIFRLQLSFSQFIFA